MKLFFNKFGKHQSRLAKISSFGSLLSCQSFPRPQAMQTLLTDLTTSKPWVCRSFFVLTSIPRLTAHTPRVCHGHYYAFQLSTTYLYSLLQFTIDFRLWSLPYGDFIHAITTWLSCKPVDNEVSRTTFGLITWGNGWRQTGTQSQAQP